MSKKALVITAADFDSIANNSSLLRKTDDLTHISLTPPSLDDQHAFFYLNAFLADRPACETDESILQVLPYVTLADKDGNVFCYQRGVAGTEARLHGAYSIGYGGHIENAPNEERSLTDVIVECVVRELEEEVALKVTTLQVDNALRDATLFYDTSNPVGKVHLCLNITLVIDPSQIGKEEEEQIQNTRLLSIDELVNSFKTGEIDIESWSQILLGLK